MRNINRCSVIFRALVFIAPLLQLPAWAQGGGGQTISKDYDEGFKVAPIPIVQPVTEEGAGLAGIYRYHLHSQSTSPSSYFGLGGFVTTNRSWGAGAAQVFYLDEGKVRARMAASYADVRYNFYGIGTAAGERGGDAGVSVLMEQQGVGGLAELLYRFYAQWYGGATYRLVGTNSNFRPNPEFDSASIPPSQLKLRVASLGPRILRDARDDSDYPTEGSLFDAHAGFLGGGVGSEASYQTYDISFSKYISTGPRGVLAMRGAACYVSGNVPFWDLCLLTTADNLRGYVASRYRDTSYLASQVEYRMELGKRFGAVGFIGAGEVGPKFSDYNTGNLLPGGGVGLRYRITRESHVNLRFDYAWGKDSHQAYFYIGEAF